MPVDKSLFNLKSDIGKQVLWQTVKTQTKCPDKQNLQGQKCIIFLEILTGNLLKYTMVYSILILSKCMGLSIRMKRVKEYVISSINSCAGILCGLYLLLVFTMALTMKKLMGHIAFGLSI